MTIKKVLFQLNQLGYGGTEKAILSFAEHLDPYKFEAYLFYWDDRFSLRYYRLKFLSFFSATARSHFQTYYVDRLAREQKFQKVFGQGHFFHGKINDFKKCIQDIGPDVIHLNRGVEIDFYTDFISDLDPKIKIIESNIFGKKAPEKYIHRLNKFLFVSSWLKMRSPWAQEKSDVLYNPILTPHSEKDLRTKLDIPQDAIVLGRASRPDLDQDPFLESVYDRLFKQSSDDIFLLSLGPKPKYSSAFEDKYKDRIRMLPTTIDEGALSEFYNTLDIFTHRRPEGETFGMIIAECMLHKIPVVSHRSPVDNAQIEILGNEAFISDYEDIEAYKNILHEMIKNVAKRQEIAKNLQLRADQLFRADRVAKDLERHYESLWL